MNNTSFEKEFFNFAKGLLIYSLGSFAGPIVGFFLIPIYTTYLTPTEYGILGLILSIQALISVFADCQLGASIYRHYFDYPLNCDKQRDMITTGIFLQTIIALSISFIFYISSNWVSIVFFKNQYIVFSLRYVSASIFLNALSNTFFNLLRAKNKAFSFVFLSLFSLISTVYFNIYFIVILRIGVEGYFIGSLFSNLIIFIFLSLFVLHYFNGGRVHYSYIRKHFRLSFPLVPASLFIWFIQKSDKVIVKLLLPGPSLGLYVLAQNISSLHNVLLLYPIKMAYSPYVYSIYKNNDAQYIISRIITYISLLSLFIVFFMGSTAEQLLYILSRNKEYSDASMIILPLALCGFFETMQTLLVIPLGIEKKSEYVALLSFLSAIGRVSIMITFISYWGIFGAAWGGVLSFAFYLILSRMFSKSYYMIKIEWTRICKIIIVGILSYFISISFSFNSVFLTFVLRCFSMTSIFIAGVYISRFLNEGEKAFIMRTLIKLMRFIIPYTIL